MRAGWGRPPPPFPSRARLIFALLKKFRLCGHPDPEIRGGGGSLQKIFFGLSALSWSRPATARCDTSVAL